MLVPSRRVAATSRDIESGDKSAHCKQTASRFLLGNDLTLNCPPEYYRPTEDNDLETTSYKAVQLSKFALCVSYALSSTFRLSIAAQAEA